MGGGGWSTGAAGGWTSGHREAKDSFDTEKDLVRGMPQKSGYGSVGVLLWRPGTSLEAMGVEGKDESIHSSTMPAVVQAPCQVAKPPIYVICSL